MELIDLNTPKPPASANMEFSPTLIRGLNECFKKSALQFGSSSIDKESHHSMTPRKPSIGSKRGPGTPLTPLYQEAALSSKRRILGEVNQQKPVFINSLKKEPVIMNNLKDHKLRPLSSRIAPSAVLEAPVADAEEILLEFELRKIIAQRQITIYNELSDFIRLEQEFGVYPA